MPRRSAILLAQVTVVFALWGCASGPLPGDRLAYTRGLSNEEQKAAHAQFEQEVAALTGQLTAKFNSQRPQRIAVLSFESTTGRTPDSLGAYLTEKVTNLLYARQVGTVVERTFLNKVLQEIERGYSGPFDPLSLKEIGHLLNADTLVFGSYTLLNNGLTEIMARAVSVETGEVVGASTATVSSNLVPIVPVYQPPTLLARSDASPPAAQDGGWQPPEGAGAGTYSMAPSPAPDMAYATPLFAPVVSYPAYPIPPVFIPSYGYGYAVPVRPPSPTIFRPPQHRPPSAPPSSSRPSGHRGRGR